MNIQNDAGQSAQAIALSTGGNYQSFYASSLLGWQDTAYVHTGTQFFGRCYIEGAVDFIFGTTANAWFVCLDAGNVESQLTNSFHTARCHNRFCKSRNCHGSRTA